MARYAFFLVLLPCLPGCLQSELRDNTTTLAKTTTELLYQQILDNLAHTIDCPDDLPYLDIPAAGTAQVQQSYSATYTPGFDFITSAGVYLGRWLFDHQTAAFGGTRTASDSWQISPLTNPDRMFLMRCAYRKAVGIMDAEDEGILRNYYALRVRQYNLVEQNMEKALKVNEPSKLDLKKGAGQVSLLPAPGRATPDQQDENSRIRVASYEDNQPGDAPKSKGEGPAAVGGAAPLPLKIDYERFIKTGWFGVVGKKRDVPKCACYVGQHCGTYVWVSRDHIDDLAKFTVAIIDIYFPFTFDPGSGQTIRSQPYIPAGPPATLRK